MQQKAKLWIWIVFAIVILGFAVFVYYAQQGKITISADTTHSYGVGGVSGPFSGAILNATNPDYNRCLKTVSGALIFDQTMTFGTNPIGINIPKCSQANVGGLYTTKALPLEVFQGILSSVTYSSAGSTTNSKWSLAISSAAGGKLPYIITPDNGWESGLTSPYTNKYLTDNFNGWYIVDGYDGYKKLGSMANAISKMPATGGPIYVRYYVSNTYINLSKISLTFKSATTPSPSPTTSAPTPGPTTACKTLQFKSGSFTPATVKVGDTYDVKCDYGSINDSISPELTNDGGRCIFNNFTGTVANFTCTAAKVGTYGVFCRTYKNPSGTNYCLYNNQVYSPNGGDLIITPADGPSPTPTEIPNLTAQSRCDVDGKTQVTLTWDRIPGVDVVNYDIYRYTTPTSEFDNLILADWVLSYWQQTHDSAATAGQYTCGDVPPYKSKGNNVSCSYNCTSSHCTFIDKTATGDTNKYRVRGWVTGTSPNQHVQSDKTTTCDKTDPDISDLKPTNVALEITGQTTATLSWDAVDGARSYDIYNCSGDLVAATDSTTYDLTDLTCATSYCYYVVARNDVSVSEASDQATGITNICTVSSPSGLSNIVSLVSTGSNLWINILIAILLIIGIGYFMFKDNLFHAKKPPVEPPKVK